MGVLDLAKKLNKEYSSDTLAIVAEIVPDYERFSCGDLGMDFPLYGGLPYGRICTYAGKEHSGKTTAACVELSAYQRENPDKISVFVDVEHSLDMKFQSIMTGLDLSKLVYVSPETQSGEQILDMILEFQKQEDIGMIVLDSIPALVSGKEWDNDIEKDLGKSGNMARPLHRFCKEIAPLIAKRGNILIFVNQVRISGTTFTGAAIYSEPGGDAPKYYSSVKVRFGTRKFTKGEKVDLTDGEEADGFRLQFAITKNKTASTQRGGGFLTFRYDKGLDWMFDTLEVAMKYGFIERPNNQTYVLVDLESGESYKDETTGEELRFRGKQALKDYLSANVGFQKMYIDMLTRYISKTEKRYGSLLDERELVEIKNEARQLGDDE